jgi:hypothetical protein
VFGADDILDDKIDIGMKHVFEKMCINTEFNKIIEEMTQIALKTFMPNTKLDESKLHDLKQLITLTLFSQHIFYITHKCVCQQLELGTIDECLLLEVKAHSIDVLKKLYPDN